LAKLKEEIRKAITAKVLQLSKLEEDIKESQDAISAKKLELSKLEVKVKELKKNQPRLPPSIPEPEPGPKQGTITDQRTGLIWLKNANCFGRQNWNLAKQSVANLAHGQCGLRDGSKAGDWRLPTREELKMMVEKKSKSPDFVSVQPHTYWSSENDGNNNWAWYVNFQNTVTVGAHDKTYYSHYVWPVRNGQ